MNDFADHWPLEQICPAVLIEVGFRHRCLRPLDPGGVPHKGMHRSSSKDFGSFECEDANLTDDLAMSPRLVEYGIQVHYKGEGAQWGWMFSTHPGGTKLSFLSRERAEQWINNSIENGAGSLFFHRIIEREVSAWVVSHDQQA